MRIAYILTSLGIGGAERQALLLAERMAERGHAVTVVTLRPRQAEEWATSLDPHYLGLRKTPVSLVGGLAQARRILRSFEPDLVHSHCFHSNIFARLLRLAGPAAPLISTIHNVYEGAWPRMLAYRLTDPLCRRTTAVSEAAALRSSPTALIPLSLRPVATAAPA